MTDFWAMNMDRDHKKISGGFGAFLIVAIVSLIGSFSMVAMGGEPDWGFTFATILGGFQVFLVLLVSSFFGKENGNKKPDEK